MTDTRTVREIETLKRRIERVQTFEHGPTLGAAVSEFLTLPELRGFWPFSSVNESGNAADLAAQGRTLTNNGSITRSVLSCGLPYSNLSGSNYWSRADEAGMDITGSLSLAGWFRPTSLAAQRDCISKWNGTGNQRSYALSILSTGAMQVAVSSDGAAAIVKAGTAGDMVINTWYFLGLRYTPSTELAGFTDLTKYTNTTSIPASTFNSTAAFIIGGLNAGGSMVGSGALCAVGAAAWSDAIFNNLYRNTRRFFGV